MTKYNKSHSGRRADAGAGRLISRRDFLGGMALGSGATLLSGLAPFQVLAKARGFSIPPIDPAQAKLFDGPSGVGDYQGNNGNTWDVLTRAHLIRDKHYADLESLSFEDGGDDYDVIMVGAGPATIGACLHFTRQRGSKVKGLVLENHNIFGGMARHNQFEVNGHTIYGPQASNLVFLPRKAGDQMLGEDLLFDEFTEVGMPLHYDPVELTGTDKALEADVSNYIFMWPSPVSDSIAMFGPVTRENPEPGFVTNPWVNGFEGLGYGEQVQRDLKRWMWDLRLDRPAEGLDRWLDNMSYEELLVDVHGLSPEVARFSDPILATAVGLGAGTCSAYVAATHMVMPGAMRNGDPNTDILLNPGNRNLKAGWQAANAACFPGGNSFPFRYFAKYIWPDCLQGVRTPREVMESDIRFDRLDTEQHPIRMRLGATVVDVRHVPGSGQQRVRVIYEKDERLFAAHAKSVILSSANCVNRHILGDAPGDIGKAMEVFDYGPVIVANVALTNWRFMEKLGITSVLYRDGEFGFMCNIRNPLDIGGYRAPFDPDKPIVMSFYAPLLNRDLPAREQGVALRWEMLSTPYREIEQKIIRQMVAMFGRGGFEPGRDIAGITLNRWGHAFSVPYPGFYHPADGGPSNASVLAEGYDRVFFANAELGGMQSFAGGHARGREAAEKVLNII